MYVVNHQQTITFKSDAVSSGFTRNLVAYGYVSFVLEMTIRSAYDSIAGECPEGIIGLLVDDDDIVDWFLFRCVQRTIHVAYYNRCDERNNRECFYKEFH